MSKQRRSSASHFYVDQASGIRSREGVFKNCIDFLFDMFKERELLSVHNFLTALNTNGIRQSDPRIKEVMQNLHKFCKGPDDEKTCLKTLKLDKENFKKAISPNIELFLKAFRKKFIFPDFQDFTKDVEEMYMSAKANANGKVATYIPQLAKASPDSWGVSVCTVDGQRYSIGDTKHPFTIQSCSKPLTYAMVLQSLGPDLVHKYVGTEPSGRNFNEIVLDYQNRPHNPMVNAGALMVCALLKYVDKRDQTLAETFDYVLNFLSRLAGNESLGFNNSVYLSERECADRNYAIGHFMQDKNCFPENTNLRECFDFYFQCCSMEAHCENASVIAATLANGGVCPISNEKLLCPETVRNVLSLMLSCGMYDYSGQFEFQVGLPAKSGVSGCLLLVVPNVMGICTWSPLLDSLGNSCRGIQFCEDLCNRFNFLHFEQIQYGNHKRSQKLKLKPPPGPDIISLLFSAACGDISALTRHLLSDTDMTLSDYDGRTALHLAAAEGHLNCVQFLLEQCRVPHDPVDHWGKLPIDDAKLSGHEEVVKYLKNIKPHFRLKQIHMKPNDCTIGICSKCDGCPSCMQ